MIKSGETSIAKTAMFRSWRLSDVASGTLFLFKINEVVSFIVFEFLESLNNQNYLLKKGPKVYRLMTSYSGGKGPSQSQTPSSTG